MPKKITARRRALLIRDIFNAEHDVVALAGAHELSPDELAAWASDTDNHRCLTGLCVLADLQTQLLLSRYRLLAATRLIRLATQEEEGASSDVARRACVDLLKLDLKRAEAQAAAGPTAADEPEAMGSLRDLLYAAAAAGEQEKHQQRGEA